MVYDEGVIGQQNHAYTRSYTIQEAKEQPIVKKSHRVQVPNNAIIFDGAVRFSHVLRQLVLSRGIILSNKTKADMF